jgi:hypothetical protein
MNFPYKIVCHLSPLQNVVLILISAFFMFQSIDEHIQFIINPTNITLPPTFILDCNFIMVFWFVGGEKAISLPGLDSWHPLPAQCPWRILHHWARVATKAAAYRQMHSVSGAQDWGSLDHPVSCPLRTSPAMCYLQQRLSKIASELTSCSKYKCRVALVAPRVLALLCWAITSFVS